MVDGLFPEGAEGGGWWLCGCVCVGEVRGRLGRGVLHMCRYKGGEIFVHEE